MNHDQLIERIEKLERTGNRWRLVSFSSLLALIAVFCLGFANQKQETSPVGLKQSIEDIKNRLDIISQYCRRNESGSVTIRSNQGDKVVEYEFLFNAPRIKTVAMTDKNKEGDEQFITPQQLIP